MSIRYYPKKIGGSAFVRQCRECLKKDRWKLEHEKLDEEREDLLRKTLYAESDQLRKLIEFFDTFDHVIYNLKPVYQKEYKEKKKELLGK